MDKIDELIEKINESLYTEVDGKRFLGTGMGRNLIEEFLRENTPRWISVEEQEPPKDMEILVCQESEPVYGIHLIEWLLDRWEYAYRDLEFDYPFTHWMPLPKHINHITDTKQ